jgi:hypothetical protein
VIKEVNGVISLLMKQNLFTKCYGPRQLMSDLQHMNVLEDKIPSYKQLQNTMFYFHHSKLNNLNKVNPLEDKLWPLVFKGDESEEQPSFTITSATAKTN